MRSSRLLLAICAALCLVVALPDIAPAQPVHEQPPELGRRHAERHPPRAPVSSDLTEPTVLLGAHGDRVVTDQRTAPVAPGVELTSFEWVDQAGWIQGDVLTVDLSETRTNAGLLFPGAVAATAPLSQMAAEQGAIAGVNGDFFDINATGAPLGAAIADTTPLKGAIEGRELSTGVDVNGIGRIAQVLLEGTITLPDGKVALAGLNQHRLPADGIGAFTPLWGEASRARAVEGATTTHEVTVTGGVVTSSGATVGGGNIPEDGFMLVGREEGAKRLAELEPGDAAGLTFDLRSDARLRFALGGGPVLVRDGEVAALDDRVAAPRTAVGYSSDGRTMYLAVVDGRQVDSRGMTLAELGAHSALNLDGGGSTTMLARQPGAEPAVVNSPSDGNERPVPNGVGLFAAPGSGDLTGLRVEPLLPDEDAGRVFPGLTRTLTAAGYDETFAPVPAKVRWQVRPGLHRRSFPLRYPATVTWSGDGVVVGAGADAERGARRTTRRCVGIRALRARPSTHRPWAYASPVW